MIYASGRGIEIDAERGCLLVTAGLCSDRWLTPYVTLRLTPRQGFAWLSLLRQGTRWREKRGSGSIEIRQRSPGSYPIGKNRVVGKLHLAALSTTIASISVSDLLSGRTVTVINAKWTAIDLFLVSDMIAALRQLPAPTFRFDFRCPCQRDYARGLLEKIANIEHETSYDPARHSKPAWHLLHPDHLDLQQHQFVQLGDLQVSTCLGIERVEPHGNSGLTVTARTHNGNVLLSAIAAVMRNRFGQQLRRVCYEAL